MRFVLWNLLIASWLLVSAFVLPRPPSSQAAIGAAAVAVGAAAILAAWRPSARVAITGIAVLLALAALLVPELSTGAAVSDAVVAALLFAPSVAAPAPAPAQANRAHPAI